MIKKEDLFVAGKICKSHGIKGECVISIDADVLADTDCIICDINGLLVPFYIEERRQKNDTQDIIKIEGVDSDSDLEPLLGSPIYLPKDMQDSMEDVSYRYFIGFNVIANGNLIGSVADIDDSTLNVLMNIVGERKSYLIPLVEDFITNINHKSKELYVEVPDELLEI